MQEQPLTLRTTTPPWLHHCYVVRIIDFRKSNANDCGGRSVNGIETALFVQTEDKPVSGQLFTVRQVPYSRTFTCETESCQNPKDDPKFDSETGIGYIFKKDFKELFPHVLTSCPLPHAPGPEYAPMSTQSEKSHAEAREQVEELQSPLTNSTE
ncbi:hypothetical protein BGZ61DRAFT_528411 [Ilyonectria robusta]|uniref:uncharacterized protein n=1 Tax=Ilyonectria robusta TaxID=1079257 RepID=UPI001E8D0ACA|nr:uncharacterized protein BGZ61DRAFT_528411 [Ilyonectria robusta]KAH8735197.1 hypothetical protein BGZ61DRAFT_528411 [Ilyonectria robusta]